jgi:hypothetical protein
VGEELAGEIGACVCGSDEAGELTVGREPGACGVAIVLDQEDDDDFVYLTTIGVL